MTSPYERAGAAHIPRRDTLHWRDLNAREVDLLVAETFDGWHWEAGYHGDVTGVPRDQEQIWLLPIYLSSAWEVPNGEWTTYYDVGQKPRLAPDDGDRRFFYNFVPGYHADMGCAWLIVQYIHEHLIFSKREAFYKLLQTLTRIQGTYTERHGLEEERTVRYYTLAAWPDMLGYLTPSLICHAGLRVMGVIEAEARDPYRFHSEPPDADADNDGDETATRQTATTAE